MARPGEIAYSHQRQLVAALQDLANAGERRGLAVPTWTIDGYGLKINPTLPAAGDDATRVQFEAWVEVLSDGGELLHGREPYPYNPETSRIAFRSWRGHDVTIYVVAESAVFEGPIDLGTMGMPRINWHPEGKDGD